VLDAIVIQIDEGDARLHHGVCELVVYLEDLVHAVQVQCHRSVDSGRRPTIAGEREAKSATKEPWLYTGFAELTRDSSLWRKSREG
jgi:hypothetical protein